MHSDQFPQGDNIFCLFNYKFENDNDNSLNKDIDQIVCISKNSNHIQFRILELLKLKEIWNLEEDKKCNLSLGKKNENKVS